MSTHAGLDPRYVREWLGGKGRVLLQLASCYPNSHFTGYDLSAEALAEARRHADKAGLTNIQFEARDLSDFEHSAKTERFDFVTAFDAEKMQDGLACTVMGWQFSLMSGYPRISAAILV